MSAKQLRLNETAAYAIDDFAQAVSAMIVRNPVPTVLVRVGTISAINA